MPTGGVIVTAALREIRVINAIDAPDGEDAEFALGKANRILDRWNAQQRFVYADTISPFTFTADVNPHTIGPGGDWELPARPESIEAATVISGGVRKPLNPPRDAAWWMGRRTSVPAGLPSNFYYQTDWPLGRFYVDAMPGDDVAIELLRRVVLTALTLEGEVTLPPGYEDAITMTLAEELSGPFNVALTPRLVDGARTARSAIWGTQTEIPRMRSDFGGRRGFDFQTGGFR